MSAKLDNTRVNRDINNYVQEIIQHLMPVILGIYLFVPFLSTLVQKFSLKDFALPLCLCFFLFFCVESLRKMTSGAVNCLVYPFFGGSFYGFYYIFGYLFYHRMRKARSLALPLSLFVILFACSIFVQVWACRSGQWEPVWYSHPLLFLTSVAFFDTLLNCTFLYSWGIWKYFSRFSFGIYLVHTPIQILLQKYINFKCIFPLQVVALFFLTSALSFAVVWLISRLPAKLGRLLALLK